MKLEQKVVQILVDTEKTLSIAESCTGGLLSNRITDVPGASNCLNASIVTYSNEAKMRLLGVKKELLTKFGAVSEEVSMAMAEGIRTKMKSTYGIGITGIAGPSGGSRKKPVGLVFISINTNRDSLCLKCQFEGGRKKIKKDATDQALKLILEFIA